MVTTYNMDSVTVASLIIVFWGWAWLLMSIDDDISHCVAAAYCRHTDFNFSIFCRYRKNITATTAFKICYYIEKYIITLILRKNYIDWNSKKPWGHQVKEASILSDIYQERSRDAVSPVRWRHIVSMKQCFSWNYNKADSYSYLIYALCGL